MLAPCWSHPRPLSPSTRSGHQLAPFHVKPRANPDRMPPAWIRGQPRPGRTRRSGVESVMDATLDPTDPIAGSARRRSRRLLSERGSPGSVSLPGSACTSRIAASRRSVASNSWASADLHLGSLALQGEQHPGSAHHRPAPAKKAVQRSHRPRNDHVVLLSDDPPREPGPRARGHSVPVRRTTVSRKVVRRSIGSSKVTERSGRAMARGMPGSPAPEPTSTTDDPSGMRSATARLLRMCRSQIRSASRGPISPYRIPRSSNISTNTCSRTRAVPSVTPGSSQIKQ